MRKELYFVGLDVDDKNFHLSVIAEATGEIINLRSQPVAAKLIDQLKKVDPRPEVFRICYEAGYLGFSLQRSLTNKGYNCEVVAPGLIPKLPSKHLKTDRIDSEKLAEFFMKGLLTTVHVSDEEDESHRDLVRVRTYVVGHIKSLKSQIQGLCRRWGLDKYTGQSWTLKHRQWLDSQVKGLPSYAQISIKTLLSTVDHLEQTTEYLSDEEDNLAADSKYKDKVQALTCFRGIKTLTAMTLLTEIGDFRRFAHPEKLVSYVGLGIREYSSGERSLLAGKYQPLPNW